MAKQSAAAAREGLTEVAAEGKATCCLQGLPWGGSVLSLKWQLQACLSATLQVLQKICWYVVLAAASSDQVTLLQMTAADKKLDQLPAYKELLQTFITKEVSPLSCCPCAANRQLHYHLLWPVKQLC